MLVASGPSEQRSVCGVSKKTIMLSSPKVTLDLNAHTHCEVKRNSISSPSPDGRIGVLLILALSMINIGLWLVGVAIIGRHHGFLALAFLAWSFGLRHALDADHIAAIDLVTRRLMESRKSVTLVGFFFSSGHSCVVTLACLALFFLPSHAWLDQAHLLGGYIGTTISILFLGITAIANMLALHAQCHRADDTSVAGTTGILTRTFGRVVNLVDRDVYMFPLGFLFGLGFDTATEIGLLGLASSNATNELGMICFLLLPAFFASGMALMDSLDNVLMVRAWQWSGTSPKRRATYTKVVTILSSVAAVGVALIELVQLANGSSLVPVALQTIAKVANEHFQALGTGLIVTFLCVWGGASLYPARPRS